MPPLTPEQIQNYFQQYDTNNDGVLTKDELIEELKVLEPGAGEEIEVVISPLFDKFDTDKNGLTIQEFSLMANHEDNTEEL